MRFQHILVATDFSETAARAVDAAIALAASLQGRVTIVHVVDPRALRMSMGEAALYPSAAALVDALHRAAGDSMRKLLAELKKPEGVEVQGELLEGVPAEEIVEAARRRDADLVVVGTLGRSGVRHLLQGSVAGKVVRLSRRPVLTIGPDDAPPSAASS